MLQLAAVLTDLCRFGRPRSRLSSCDVRLVADGTEGLRAVVEGEIADRTEFPERKDGSSP